MGILGEINRIIQEIKGILKEIKGIPREIHGILVKTQVKKTDRKSKKRRSNDKKGGGRQPQSRKLDRRKYLEYKYAARELLDNESVSEEHRSNILGQIWAKGERTGVEDAISFIAQKESENIIPSDVADEFRNMIRKYTTKR